MELHKKIKEKKSRAKNFGLLKEMYVSIKNKKTNSFTVLLILFESMKEGWHQVNV